MAQRPATVLNPAKIALLRKSLIVTPMDLPLTGLSMFPAIRPGDRCRTTAVDPEALRVGDVVLATRDDRLYAHRLVDVLPGPPTQWLLKGDTMLQPDPPFDAGDILGQVIGVERRGRYRDFRSPLGRWHARIMAAVSGPYSRTFTQIVVLRRRLLAKLADLPSWRARRKPEGLTAAVRPAGPDDVDGVAMILGEQQALHQSMDRISMEALRENARAMLRGAEFTGATLWVAEHHELVSAIAVIGPVLSAPGWWVMSVYVKMSLRGCGMAERLIRAGLEDAAARGVPAVHYAAYENNTPSLRLARKLGFEPDEGEEARAFLAHYAHHPSPVRLLTLKKTL